MSILIIKSGTTEIAGGTVKGDFTEAVKRMCPNLEVLRLNEPKIIVSSYKKALNRKDGKSTILVEYGDYYNEK